MSVFVFDHALIKHKLTIMRDRNTPMFLFKEVLDEIAMLMAYEVTKDLPLKDKVIDTPVARTVGSTLDTDIILMPILRAGIGLVDGFRRMIPEAKIGHIGMKRDEETLLPHVYYASFPKGIEDAQVIAVDPMLATGGSAIDAIEQLKKEGAKKIVMVALVGAPEGVEAFTKAHPDVDLYLAALDDHLNDTGYIVPGLGDAGDRLFGTD